MRLTTIWTIRAMTLRERLNRTAEWAWSTAAAHLPDRLAYWSFIHVGVRNIGDDVVPEVGYTTILERAGKKLDAA